MRQLIIPIITTSLVACGGGGSGSGGNTAKDNYRPDGELKGIVTDAIVTNSTVDFYRFTKSGKKEFLAESVTTDGQGKFSQSINSESGFALLVAKGGSYVEEETGKVITLANQHALKALTYYESGKPIEVIPNPWSTIAFGYVECRVNQGVNLNNAHGDSLDLMSSIVGVPVLSTYPSNPTYQDNAYLDVVDDSIKFGALAAGISKWTHDEALAQEVEPHQPGMTSIDLALAMYNDIKADCHLDGYGARPDGTRYNLAFGKRLLNTNVYRTEIPRKMLEFMNGEKNVTRVSSADLVLYANQQASSTAKLFGDALPEPLDDQGPFIQLSITDGDYVHGNVNFQVDAKDISGVTAVKVSFGDQFEDVVNGDNSEVGFSSKNFKDGPLEVTIEATDGLNNVSKKVITLNIQNAKPIINLKSDALVKDSTYPIQMNVENLPQGLKSAFANGVQLNVDGLYVWGEVPLKQGKNKVDIALVDLMGVRHEDYMNVFLDVIKPTLDPLVPSLHPEEQFQVRYLPDGAKEPVWRNFREKSEEGIFVPRDRRFCGSTHLKEEELRDQGWPYVAISALDAGDFHTGEMRPYDLEVTYTYEVGDEVRINQRAGTLRFGKRHVVPFCQEFLGDEWWTINDRGADAKLTFFVKDQAGNESTTDFQFKFAESPTVFEPVLGEDVYFSADADLITFNATGMEGVDRVELFVDGEYHRSVVDFENGRAHIAAEEFKDGLHEAYFVIKDNGKVILKTEPTKFRIDNTPPKAHLISKPVSGTERYVIEFGVEDGLGAGFDPESLVVSNRSLDEETFDKVFKTDRGTYTVAVDLVPGINPLVFDFMDKVGNKQQMVFENVGYDASAPILTWTYPNNTMHVFGYSKNDPHNPVVLQPFVPTGTAYPLYLNDEMINFKPTGQASFQGFRPFGDDRVGWRPFIAPSFTDRYDVSEWGRVGSDHLDVYYEVFVDGIENPIFTAEINEPRFGYSGVITLNREDMGDEFYRVNEITDVTVKIHLKDGVGHTSTYSVDFKVYFDPGVPATTSFIHTETTSLASTVNITNVASLNRGLKTHELKLTNTRPYPVWVNLENAGLDQVKVTRDIGRMANIYREVNIYDRALVKADRYEKGRGYNPNYYLVEIEFPGDQWDSQTQVLAGSTTTPLGVIENSKGRVEKAYLKHYGNAPVNTISKPSFMAVNSHGSITVDNYVQVDSPWCPSEPDYCWKESGTKTLTFKGKYGGYFIQDNESVLVRKHTQYEVMPGYPKPELENQTNSYPSKKTELNVSGSPEVREIDKRNWYLINPGESVNVSRSIKFAADVTLGDCNWVYETVKTCLRQVFADIGGAVKVSTRVQTLDGKWGSVVKATTHQLEPTQLKVSR